MTVLQKTPITFRFTGPDQDIGEKHVKPGQLIKLENARQVGKWDYEPRQGFNRTTFTAASGSWLGNPDSYAYTDTRLAIDNLTQTNGQAAWAYDIGSASWREMHHEFIKRPMHTETDVFLPSDAIAKPVIVRAGSNDWYFAITAAGYVYSVRDYITHREIVARTLITGSGLQRIAVVADATNVWLFGVLGGTTVISNKFVIATPATTPVSATYQTIASAQLRDVDAHVYDDGQVFVVCAGHNGASYHYSHSVLDKTTGAAAASPAAVTTTAADGSGTCGGVSILVDGGGSGSAYYSVWRSSATNFFTGLFVHQVTRSTNAIAATSPELRNSECGGPASCGYINLGGLPVVFSGADEGSVSNYYDSINIKKHVATNMSTWTTSLFGQQAWIATKPFQVTGDADWFLITGSGAGASAANFQYTVGRNAYHIRAASASAGRVVSQFEYATAGDLDNNAIILGASLHRTCGTNKVIVSNDIAFYAGLSDGAGVRFKIDFTPTYSPGVGFRSKLLCPGPVPFAFGQGDKVRELTPLLAPPYTVADAVGLPTGITSPVGIQFVFRLTDSDGNEDYSGPSPIQYISESSLPYPLVVPTYRSFLGDGKAQIEIYITDAGGTTPILRYVRENDHTVDSLTLTISRTTYDRVEPKSIYTTGGGLSANPAPPCRSAVVYKNRVILSGTVRRGQIMPSMELEEKRGPRFNPILASYWRETSSDIQRLEPISEDACGVWSDTHVAYFSGVGPNGRGANPYKILTVPAAKGIKNVRSVVTGPAGAYYQANDDRYYLLVPGGVEPIGTGVIDYTSPVSTCLHDNKNNVVMFWLEDGKLLVLDYDRPTDETQRGQWSVWSSTGLFRGYGAAMVNGAPEFMETNGHRRTYQAAFTDSSVASGEQTYNMALHTGELACFDLARQFRLDTAIVHGEFVGSTSLTFEAQMDWGGSSLRSWSQTRTITSAPFQRYFKPAGGDRIQSVKAILTVPATNGGARISGLTLLVQDRGNIRFSNLGQRTP